MKTSRIQRLNHIIFSNSAACRTGYINLSKVNKLVTISRNVRLIKDHSKYSKIIILLSFLITQTKIFVLVTSIQNSQPMPVYFFASKIL